MFDTRVKLRHLNTFIEVARLKSVVKAADILHVTQPAVTKTIRELEEALGVALFEREGRGIRITRHGEIFLRHAGAAVAALRQGIDSVSRDALDTAPPVRVGALPTVSTRIMPRAMSLFLRHSTGSRIKIVTGENSVLLEQLRVGDLDLVVGRLAAPDKMTGFSFEHLYSEPVVFAVRPDHPLLDNPSSLFSELGRFPILMPTRGSIIRPLVDQFLIANGLVSFHTQVETVSHSFGRSFVRASDAVWIISEGVVSDDLADGLLIALPVDTSGTKGPVGLTLKTDAPPSAPQIILMQTIRQAAEEIMPAR